MYDEGPYSLALAHTRYDTTKVLNESIIYLLSEVYVGEATNKLWRFCFLFLLLINSFIS